MDEPDEAAVWARVAPHLEALATVAAFADACNAERVAVLLDVGDTEGLVLEAGPGRPVEVVLGEVAYVVPRESTAPAAALPVDVSPAPPGTALTVDAATGEVAGPIGVVPALAEGVLALATALGGRTVVTAEFATRDPRTPFTLAARAGEPVVLAVEDEHFEL